MFSKSCLLKLSKLFRNHYVRTGMRRYKILFDRVCTLTVNRNGISWGWRSFIYREPRFVVHLKRKIHRNNFRDSIEIFNSRIWLYTICNQHFFEGWGYLFNESHFRKVYRKKELQEKRRQVQHAAVLICNPSHNPSYLSAYPIK